MKTILYSFPTRMGTSGIGMTSWHQVDQICRNNINVILFAGSCEKRLPSNIEVHQTFRIKKLKLPMKLFGYKSHYIHDFLTARYLYKNRNKIDAVHCWPSGSLLTLKVAKKYGIKSFLERPSSHTKYVFDVVQNECLKLGITLGKSHYSSFDKNKLLREEREFKESDFLLCPSEFVVKTFLEQGYSIDKMRCHHYGYDPDTFYPNADIDSPNPKFRMLYVANCSPLKGLHYALEAWFNSKACENGLFSICGDVALGYESIIEKFFDHPSIEYCGFSNNIAEMMRKSNALILPSLTEGSSLVTYEARACGCVLLISDASGAHCADGVECLIHKAGNSEQIRQHIDKLYLDKELFLKLRENSLATISNLTWEKAGKKLAQMYLDEI